MIGYTIISREHAIQNYYYLETAAYGWTRLYFYKHFSVFSKICLIYDTRSVEPQTEVYIFILMINIKWTRT